MSSSCFTRVTCGPLIKSLTPAHGYKVPKTTKLEPWNQWLRIHIFSRTTHSFIFLSQDGNETTLRTRTEQDPYMTPVYPFISINEYEQSYTTMVSSFLSSRGVRASDMASVVEDIDNYCRDITVEDLEYKDYQVYNLDVMIPFYYDHVTCEECLLNRAVRESLQTVRLVPASSSWVERLVMKVDVKGRDEPIAAEDGDVNEGDNCSICLEEFRVQQCVSRMPCSHAFHETCIMDWLRRSHFCPLCRFPMPTDEA